MRPVVNLRNRHKRQTIPRQRRIKAENKKAARQLAGRILLVFLEPGTVVR
jgi:hypothetical protein